MRIVVSIGMVVGFLAIFSCDDSSRRTEVENCKVHDGKEDICNKAKQRNGKNCNYTSDNRCVEEGTSSS
jgi:hypothetical protein